jgi:hypothetical protein
VIGTFNALARATIRVASKTRPLPSHVRRAVAILYRQSRVDRCWTGTESYVVLPVAAAVEAVSAA